jgi:hypothetical protein
MGYELRSSIFGFIDMKSFLVVTLLLLFLCLPNHSFGQDSLKNDSYRNSISISTGTILVYFSLMGSYERELFTRPKNFFFNKTYLHAGYGIYASWGGPGQVMDLEMVTLFGKRKSHLEIGLGVAGLYDSYGYDLHIRNKDYLYNGQGSPSSRWDYMTGIAAMKLAYRYQKPDGKFIFRSGIGSPEGLFLSFGTAF